MAAGLRGRTPKRYDQAWQRVRTQDGVAGVAVEYAYSGDTLIAERLGNEWVPMVYGLDLLQRGDVSHHCSWRNDLVRRCRCRDDTY
ncbi:hypothetical protein DCOP10_116111 [Armatimonadetes bacterium DC]|nr:hypothetical protein DCOP10_116111 [Armatimonadetes bacterium DC]